MGAEVEVGAEAETNGEVEPGVGEEAHVEALGTGCRLVCAGRQGRILSRASQVWPAGKSGRQASWRGRRGRGAGAVDA